MEQVAQVDQAVQVELVQVDLADLVQVAIVQVDLADLVQVAIVQVDLADLVQQVLVVGLLVLAHQAVLQVERQVVDQVDVRIQQVVAVTQRARLVNLAADHQRVVSQSVQSVKSSTT